MCAAVSTALCWHRRSCEAVHFFALQKQHKIENANKDLILPAGADISCGLRGGVG